MTERLMWEMSVYGLMTEEELDRLLDAVHAAEPAGIDWHVSGEKVKETE